jgi:CRP-like cAMP-binding protein
MENQDFPDVPPLFRARELISRYALGMKNSKEQALKSTWLFSECSQKELRLIARASDGLIVPAGQVIIKEGTMGQEFYLILSGSCSVKRKGRLAATLGPGQHFGELALLDPRPRNATVTATSEMELVVLGKRELTALLDSVPSISKKLLSAMAARVREHDLKAIH